MADAVHILASDPALAAVMRQADGVARSNATVLISGESGTGKDLVAGYIHRASGRADGPFVVLNCAELFGGEQGAFPGAMAPHTGKFEAAHGGTLLLDEVGELDLRMQAKLLRAVQHREVDRVAGGPPVAVDCRIIATTNRNLAEEVRLGRFRADLFFRLNVIAMRVPPLRERLADIPALAALFVRQYAALNGRVAVPIAADAMDLLVRHSWPGNVRELENVMHRAVLTAAGPCITAHALDIDADEFPIDAAVPEGVSAVHTAGRTIEAVEKDMILDTLRHCKGNRAQTAAVLGISIRTLRNKLHDYERNGTRIPRPVIVAVA